MVSYLDKYCAIINGDYNILYQWLQERDFDDFGMHIVWKLLRRNIDITHIVDDTLNWELQKYMSHYRITPTIIKLFLQHPSELSDYVAMRSLIAKKDFVDVRNDILLQYTIVYLVKYKCCNINQLFYGVDVNIAAMMNPKYLPLLYKRINKYGTDLLTQSIRTYIFSRTEINMNTHGSIIYHYCLYYLGIMNEYFYYCYYTNMKYYHFIFE